MADKDNGLFILVVLLSCLSFVFSLFSFAPTSYNDLEDLPELFEVGDIPNIDLQHGLCLWLPFDGVALDKSGYRFDGSVSGSLSYVSGLYNEAGYSANTSYVTVSDNVVLNSGVVSVSCWFKFNSFSQSSNWLFDKYDYVAPRNGIICYVSNLIGGGYYRLFWRSYNGLSSKTIIGSAEIELDTWYYFYGSISESNIVFWLYNSTSLIEYVSAGSGLLVGDSTGYNLRVLSNGDGNIDVLMDEFRLYNRVLSEYEIEALYNLNN